MTQVRYQVPEPAAPVWGPRPRKPGGDERLDAGLRHLAVGLRGRATWAMPDIYAAWNYDANWVWC